MNCTHSELFCRIQYLFIDKLDLKQLPFPVHNLSNSTKLTQKRGTEYFTETNFCLTAASQFSLCI